MSGDAIAPTHSPEFLALAEIGAKIREHWAACEGCRAASKFTGRCEIGQESEHKADEAWQAYLLSIQKPQIAAVPQ